LSIGGIPQLILATQETRCVGKSGGNIYPEFSSQKVKHVISTSVLFMYSM
jgi:hypothetical protein